MSPALSTPKILGERCFQPADQQRFAALSHDWNPMHVDAVAARRLLSGRQVVHGIHTLLCALDLWLAGRPAAPLRLHCSFANPVNVGDRVVFSQTDGLGGSSTLIASVDGLVCTEVVINGPAPAAHGAHADVAGAAPASLRRRVIGALSSPLDEPAGSQVGQCLSVAPWHSPEASDFPHVAAVLGPASVSAIARLSFFVGMVCPGLHSVFSSVQFTLGSSTAADDTLNFEARRYDARFRLFTINFRGPISGEIKAFLRPPPQTQPSARQVADLVPAAEFAGTRSLVIGGSRGLGEMTAKILAGGGGQVVITYAAGRDDALAVAADIHSAGRGDCQVAQLDLRADAFDSLALDVAALDAVYYFSTPRIYAKRSELFDRRTFDEFVDFYLHRFYQLCQWLNRSERASRLKVYLPSTVAIADRPRGMTEYAMAKAAAEVMVHDLNRTLDNVLIVHTRLPRLATDQTASIIKVKVESSFDVLLSVVRAMQG